MRTIRTMRKARHSRRGEGGFSLIELIMYIVIVGVSLAGVLSLLQRTSWKSADPQMRKQALAVAEMMMERILAKDYQNDAAGNNAASPTAGCTPTTTIACRVNTPADLPNYNDVDDYNGWSQSSVYQQDGLVNTALTSTYGVVVAVATTALNGVTVKKVTVSVTGGIETISLVGYRALY